MLVREVLQHGIIFFTQVWKTQTGFWLDMLKNILCYQVGFCNNLSWCISIYIPCSMIRKLTILVAISTLNNPKRWGKCLHAISMYIRVTSVYVTNMNGKLNWNLTIGIHLWIPTESGSYQRLFGVILGGSIWGYLGLLWEIMTSFLCSRTRLTMSNCVSTTQSCSLGVEILWWCSLRILHYTTTPRPFSTRVR